MPNTTTFKTLLLLPLLLPLTGCAEPKSETSAANSETGTETVASEASATEASASEAGTTDVSATNVSATDVSATEASTTEASATATSTSATSEEDGFFDDFDGATLDSERWRIMFRNWGGQIGEGISYNGGVHPDNVALSGDGTLVLSAHGDAYEGLPVGINKDGSLRPDGKRVGAAIATDAYFASGRYEVRMKVAPVDGVCSAIWTFYYAELYPGDEGYPEGENGYYAVNHEIDIELPGRPGAAHEGISRAWALMNTWVGETGSEHTTGYTDLGAPQDDGEWHTYRFDWHTDPVSVDFYVDDVYLRTVETTVPTRAGRFTLGAWFPNSWAGSPDFATSELLVDWVRITPFYEAGDEFVEETYPDDGWAE